MIGPVFAKLRGRIRPVDAAAVVAAAWFLAHAAVYTVRAWHTSHSLTHFFVWQLGCFIALLLVAAIVRPAIAGVLIGIQLFVSTVVLLALAQDVTLVIRLLVVLLWAACAVSGMRRLLGQFVGPRYATWGVAAAAAFAALVPLCFLLGILHWLNPWMVAIIAVATALPGAIVVFRNLPSLPRNLVQTFRQFDILELCWLEAIWLILAVALVGAGSSETCSDAVRVHLPYIHQLVQDQGFSHQYACWHRLQPMAAQSCYAAFATIGSDAAAKWLSWLALVALVALIVDEVHQRCGSRRMALFAGAAVLSCPVLVELATTLYIDHLVTLFCTAGFIVLFRALNPPCWRGILLSAAIVASMDQVKYPGLIFTAIWGLIMFVTLLRRCSWPRAFGLSMAGGAMLVASACPWYIYVYAGTGNPFYPYLHNWFPTPYWTNEINLHDLYEYFFKMPPGIGGALRSLGRPLTRPRGSSRLVTASSAFGSSPWRRAASLLESVVAFRSAKVRNFRGAKGDIGGTWSSPESLASLESSATRPMSAIGCRSTRCLWLDPRSRCSRFCGLPRFLPRQESDCPLCRVCRSFSAPRSAPCSAWPSSAF